VVVVVVVFIFGHTSSRTNQHQNDAKDYWAVMSGYFAEAVKDDWLECASSGMSWDRYARSNKDVLCLWCEEKDLNEALAAKKDFPSVALQVKRLVQSCSALGNMLSVAWEQVSRACWTQDIIKKIQDVEHENYISLALRSFKDCMTLNAKAIMSQKGQKYKKMEVEFNFGGKEVKMDVGSASEEWQFHLDKRVQEVALQGGLVDFLPWEDLFFSAGSLPDVPQTIRVPEDCLRKIRDVREFCLEHIDSTMTIAHMVKAIKSKEKTLLKMNANFKLNLHMLKNYAQEWVEDDVKHQVLACLPSEQSPDISMDKVAIHAMILIS